MTESTTAHEEIHCPTPLDPPDGLRLHFHAPRYAHTHAPSLSLPPPPPSPSPLSPPCPVCPCPFTCPALPCPCSPSPSYPPPLQSALPPSSPSPPPSLPALLPQDEDTTYCTDQGCSLSLVSLVANPYAYSESYSMVALRSASWGSLPCSTSCHLHAFREEDVAPPCGGIVSAKECVTPCKETAVCHSQPTETAASSQLALIKKQDFSTNTHYKGE